MPSSSMSDATGVLQLNIKVKRIAEKIGDRRLRSWFVQKPLKQVGAVLVVEIGIPHQSSIRGVGVESVV